MKCNKIKTKVLTIRFWIKARLVLIVIIRIKRASSDRFFPLLHVIRIIGLHRHGTFNENYNKIYSCINLKYVLFSQGKLNINHTMPQIKMWCSDFCLLKYPILRLIICIVVGLSTPTATFSKQKKWIYAFISTLIWLKMIRRNRAMMLSQLWR